MDEVRARRKIEFQEEEYRLPVHWLLKKAGAIHYERKSRMMAEMIRAAAVRPGRALDVGCGDGKGTADLQKLLKDRVDFTGVDFSARAIAFARLMAPELEFRVENGSRLSFGDKSFILVVAREVIEHIPPAEVDAFLQEIRRVLQDGGLLLLTTPSVKRRIPEKHFQHFSPQSLQEVLGRNGFAVISMRGFGWWPSLKWESIYRRLISLPGCWRVHVWLGCNQEPLARADDLIVLARKEPSDV
jgi:SAM-dependent methyltransferase